jgi:hypothetical protein
MADDVAPTSKVLFRIVGKDEDDVNVETLWAFDLGQDRYRLDNTPFYAYSVSVGDVVLAPMDANEQRPTFVSVLEKSGNRTVRVIFEQAAELGNETDEHLRALVTMGCDYEGANRRYVAINIPPGVHLDVVRDYLVSNELNWEHADPSFSELYPEEA